MKKKLIMGTTTNGEYVVDIFRCIDEWGLPLDEVLDWCKEHNVTPAIASFYDRAVIAQWNIVGLNEKLSNALFDVYGATYRDECMKRLAEHVALRAMERY
jgi:hypothetical protein